MPVYANENMQMIPHQKAQQIVDTVNQARIEVQDAFKLLASAQERLGQVFGTGPYNTAQPHIWEGTIYDGNWQDKAASSDTLIARTAWRYLMHQTGMIAYMTDKRREELEEQLKKGTFPALTVENIFSTMEGLTGQVGTLLLESVKEVFDWLTPKYTHGVGALKTNKKYHLDYKVIIGSIVAYDWGKFRLSYSPPRQIRAFGNVLSLLDGQGVPEWPNDLKTQLRQALETCALGDSFTLPYFTATPRKNGNLHVVFTRHDLIDRLNQLGTDGSLGGDETK